ncbi:MAG: MarR family transcriptional regulator [Acholeplasmataceae bacterium]|jgi:DNA-binding MarR family transcriptional regulator|nr:MarR family transcriptional regulator [Acholeplasmataceae bacterium]
MDWKLNEQLCFLLYSSSRDIIKQYKPLLDPLKLTYTQYVTMIALWEEDHQSVTDLGKQLALDSGTLTPLLKKLEADGRIKRTRDQMDERKVYIDLTKEGKELAEKAKQIPKLLYNSLSVNDQDTQTLYQILSKMNHMRKTELEDKDHE